MAQAKAAYNKENQRAFFKQSNKKGAFEGAFSLQKPHSKGVGLSFLPNNP